MHEIFHILLDSETNIISKSFQAKETVAAVSQNQKEFVGKQKAKLFPGTAIQTQMGVHDVTCTSPFRD